MPTQRPHYKERIAHAEGHEIQYRQDDQDTWEDTEEPAWCEELQYRVKPETKPDVVVEANAERFNCMYYTSSEITNLRITFDGETGALKSAEVIQQS
jgi:hypothetical protein